MERVVLQLYWIPIRDWNNTVEFQNGIFMLCCNYIESLLGIETSPGGEKRSPVTFCCNYIESLLGIETNRNYFQSRCNDCCNYIESLLGIETGVTGGCHPKDMRCNYIESLLGIETYSGYWHLKGNQVATILNPY